jgi:hypothetical protein
MIEMVCITLLLYVNGEVASHVGYHKMADCLREKRIAQKTHDGDEPYRYTCQKRLVEVGKDADGNDYIIRLLDTDEAPQVKASSVTESLGG